MQQSVGLGALGGALLGGLIGYATTGKTQGALVGAAAGGVAGGTAGGVYGQHQKQVNDQARLNDYNARLNNGVLGLDKASAAAKLARQCYEQRFTHAASEYKAGRLTKRQFNERYQEVVAGLEEAAYILGEANRSAQVVATQYNSALRQETKKANVAVTKTRSQKKVPSGNAKKDQDLELMVENASKIEQRLSEGQKEEELLRQRISSTNQQAQDLMS